MTMSRQYFFFYPFTKRVFFADARLTSEDCRRIDIKVERKSAAAFQ